MSDAVLIALITALTSTANLIITLLLKRDVRLTRDGVNGRMDQLIDTATVAAHQVGVANGIEAQKAATHTRRIDDLKG